ncbi:hypothetical protein Tco_0902953 [Tanacetum coccineum]
MALSIADQIALDDALVAPADRLKIGKCNLRLSSDITSKEATLQVVYDVLKLTPFFKAFQVTADAPEIYMQEFWASAYVHNRSLSDVNVNKLHQPWRSFAAVINKCLCGTPSYDSLRLSQAQILWGMYNKKNIDYAYLLWEDFIFKIETKSSKKGSAMYYPRFTKIVVNYVMEKDPSIPRRNKVNWHYARDDPMFTTINVISRNEATQLKKFLLTKEARSCKAIQMPIPNRKSSTAPKKKKNWCFILGVPDAPDYDSEDDISWKSSDDEQDDEQAQDDDDTERHEVHETTQEEEDDDEHDDDENDQEDDDASDDDKKAKDDDDEEMTKSDNDDEDDSDNDIEGAKVTSAKSGEDATDAKDQGNEAVNDSNTDLDGRDKVMTEVEDTHVTLTPVNPDGQQQSSSVSSGFVSNMLNPNQDTGVDDIFRHMKPLLSLILM